MRQILHLHIISRGKPRDQKKFKFSLYPWQILHVAADTCRVSQVVSISVASVLSLPDLHITSYQQSCLPSDPSDRVGRRVCIRTEQNVSFSAVTLHWSSPRDWSILRSRLHYRIIHAGGKEIPQTVFVVHLQFIPVTVTDIMHHEPNTLRSEHGGTDCQSSSGMMKRHWLVCRWCQTACSNI